MKKLFTIMICLVSFTALQAQTKVGTINNEYILSQMPEIKQVEKDLTAYGEELDASIKQKYDDYRAILEKYNNERESLTKIIRLAREKKIRTAEADLQKLQENSSKLLQIKQDELLRPLYQKIAVALEAIVKEEGFTQVFNENQSLIYISPEYDLTIKVMKRIGLEISEEDQQAVQN
ncbi:MAG: OmpH family outer membrane protein [Psychroflexus salarius]